MGSSLINSTSQHIGSSGATITTSFTLAVGDLVVVHASSAGAPTFAVSDTGGTPNTYTNDVQSSASGNATCIVHSFVTHAGTIQFTVANTGVIRDVNVYQYRATNGYSALMGTAVSGIDTTASFSANGVTSSGFTNANLTTTGNALLIGGCWDQNEPVATITAGTSPTSWTAIGSPVVSYLVTEAAEAVGSISTVVTFGISANNFDSYHVVGIAVGEAAAAGAAVADGHSASSSTVATGTGGAAMGAVTANTQIIDVLFRASSASAHTCTCADQLGNVYTQIDHNDSTASHSLEWYRFLCDVTVSGTPVITCTYGASAQLDIAAAPLSDSASTPFTGGQVVNHFQSGVSIGAGGTDLQNSTNLPTLASIPTLLAAWGYCDANGTPSYGSQFNGVGTAWGTLGSGTPRLAFETLTYQSVAPISGRFTPIANQDAYTFFAAFNLPLPPATPFTRTQIFVSDVIIQQ